MNYLIREFYIPTAGEEPKDRYRLYVLIEKKDIQVFVQKHNQGFSLLEDIFFQLQELDPKDQATVTIQLSNRYRRRN